MTELPASSASTVRELPLEPDATVEIVITSGDLRLRGTDEHRVVVRSRDGEPLDDGVRIDASPGVLRIRDAEANYRFGPLQLSTRRSRDLDIDLPRTATIALRTVSGDVEATGIAGDSRWASASGNLRLAVAAGKVQVETMSGDAVLEASGAIALGARTVSGDLRVRAPRLDALDAGTTSGDVRIEGDLAGNGVHEITSVSGDVEVVTGSPVRLRVDTIAGDVHASGRHAAEGGRGQRTLVVGAGTVAVAVRTTSGDVRLRALDQPEGPAAGEPAVPVPPVPPAPPVAPEPPAPRAVDAEEDTHAWAGAEPLVDRREADRLEVLRALERGDLDIETAANRLEALEQAGPRYFPGVVLMAADPLDQVLRLVAEGRLSADEAAPILAALDERTTGPAPTRDDADRASGGRSETASPAGQGSSGRTADRSIRLEVREHGRSVVNLRLPLAVGRLALDRIPGLSGEQVERVREALSSGARGPIFEVDEDGENIVRIIVE